MTPVANAHDINFLFGRLREDECLELRVLEPNGAAGVATGYFRDPSALLAEANRLTRAGGNAYVTINPAPLDLAARSGLDKATTKKGVPTTADKDVSRRTHLLLDLDYSRPAGIAASDQELQAALALAHRIADTLQAEGWPRPAMANSGNGAHLLYAIDLPNTPEALDLVKRVLKRAQERFCGPNGVKVDQSVFNAARISRLPGTLNRKGAGTPDRPHRLACILEAPEPLAIVPEALLEAFAGPRPAEVKQQKTNGAIRNIVPRAGAGAGEFAIEEFIGRYLPGAKGPEPYDGGRKWKLPVCPWNPEHTNQSAFVIELKNGALAAGCMHDSCRDKKWDDLRALLEPERQQKKRKGRPSKDDSHKIWITDGVEHNILADLCEVVPTYNKDNRLFVYEPTGQICYFNADFTEWSPILKRQQLANGFERILGLEFWRWTDNRALRCNPPKEALERFLALGAESPLPKVKEFVRNPIVAQDGALVTKPGLHPSGIYYRPNVDLPPVPSAPTPEQVQEAVKFVNQLVADFPFADPESHQAWWAYLLTPMLGELAPRPWPMFNFSANLQGSGKGLLAGIPGKIMPPQPAAQALEQSDTEIRKVLTAELASDSGGWLILDNVKGRLDSPALEAFLTCEYWTDRILGSSKKGTWKVRTSVAVTANNLRLSKDLERRQILIRLVSKTPEPELRNDFRIPDLTEFIVKHRQRLVWSLCVILQNWLALERPKGKNRLGSFERWSEAIGGLLDSAGIGSEFLATKRLAVAGDPEPWWLFVEAWVASALSMDRQPVHELIRFAKQAGINLSDSNPASSLGKRLWSQDERPFRIGNQVYILRGKTYGRQSLWSLVRE